MWTLALVGARQIVAHGSPSTHFRVCALVKVNADTVGPRKETGVARAHIAARSVGARAVLAAKPQLTLVQISARLAVG